jgi:hypothetical protein
LDHLDDIPHHWQCLSSISDISGVVAAVGVGLPLQAKESHEHQQEHQLGNLSFIFISPGLLWFGILVYR